MTLIENAFKMIKDAPEEMREDLARAMSKSLDTQNIPSIAMISRDFKLDVQILCGYDIALTKDSVERFLNERHYHTSETFKRHRLTGKAYGKVFGERMIAKKGKALLFTYAEIGSMFRLGQLPSLPRSLAEFIE